MELESKGRTSEELLRDCIDSFLRIPVEQKWFVIGYMQGRIVEASEQKTTDKKGKS